MTNAADQNLNGSEAWDARVFRETIGYINFSNGTADPAFERNFNRLYGPLLEGGRFREFPVLLLEQLEGLRRESETFTDCEQTRQVVPLVFEQVLPAYRKHHADLLFHLPEEMFYQPLFVARVFEAVIAQGGPWSETERIVGSALDQLNDFIGFRPVAVLENGRRMQPYPHERHRPVPLFIQNADVAYGPYRELIAHTLDFFRETPAAILREAYFELERMQELAVDVRAHDHMHPVNKRTNYMFGEWDPHVIDTGGYYTRFVLRKMILDALLSWMEANRELPRDELLYDASAVLCGTMLMASAISGSGPDSHSSDVTLTSLLPKVARQRDAFYARLLSEAKGARRQRLQTTAAETQQPFGHVRQHLNMHLARYGARQVQHRHLAHLYARMGFPDASREEAAVIPSVSARFECEIQWRLTAGEIGLGRGDLQGAATYLGEIQDLIRRGIECGALVDPWNILGFQAQFPLFSSREDSVPDHRVELLLDLMEQLFGLYSKAMCEAARLGDAATLQNLSEQFLAEAERWDRYATTTVEDLPNVRGRESWESACQVSQAMTEWRQAGEAAGDIGFWRSRVGQFQSAKAYAQVTEAMLQSRDHVASMGLLMQWLGEADEVGLDAGPYSIHIQFVTWLQLVVGSTDQPSDLPPPERWQMIKRLFDYLEANAGEYWSAPNLSGLVSGVDAEDEPPSEPDLLGEDDDAFGSDEDNLFDAAYEGVIYRDSADDGFSGEMLDDSYAPGNTEFEILNRQIEPRLKFLATLAHLWQVSSASFASMFPNDTDPERIEIVRSWKQRTQALKDQLSRLLREIWRYEISVTTGDLDANVEYDVQLQTKFYMLHTTISTYISCQAAERALNACLPDPGADDRPDSDADSEAAVIAAVYRGVFQRSPAAVREALPRLMEQLRHTPLLYVPFDNGGDPHHVLAARDCQTLIRFLLEQLPQLGLLTETFDLLQHAYHMERSSRPGGLAVTEFDRLFRTALRGALLCVMKSIDSWDQRPRDREVIDLVHPIVEQFRAQWLQHSRTMRLSTVEEMHDVVLAEGIEEFIRNYGGDLFHAKLLTLGNIRAILHNGIATFLDYLEENADPLHPIRLLGDLEQGVIDDETAIDYLELIYETVVEKFDRFLEYNTTTTQSDYGEQFYSLLKFLQLEAEYDRESWNLAPDRIAHQVLASSNHPAAALIWEKDVERKTRRQADRFATQLRSLEREYGMQLPSVADHLHERFIKPLIVNRMGALVPRAQADAVAGNRDSDAFRELRNEVNEYLDSTSGSGIDVPPWLRILERELTQVETPDVLPEYEAALPVILPWLPLSAQQLDTQLEPWSTPRPASRGRRKSTRSRSGQHKKKDSGN